MWKYAGLAALFSPMGEAVLGAISFQTSSMVLLGVCGMPGKEEEDEEEEEEEEEEEQGRRRAAFAWPGKSICCCCCWFLMIKCRSCRWGEGGRRWGP